MKKFLSTAIVLSLLCGVLLFGATAFDEQKEGDNGTTTVATASMTTTTGNILACSVFWTDQTNTLTSISDGTNTLTLVDNNTNVTGGSRGANGYKENITGVTGAVTATLSGAGLWTRIVCQEITGGATASALDQHAIIGQATSATTANLITTGNVTTTTDGQYIFSALSTSNGNTATAGTISAFTQRTNINSTTYETGEDFVQPTQGAIAATWTPVGAGATNWQISIMTFKAAGGAAAPNGHRSMRGFGH